MQVLVGYIGCFDFQTQGLERDSAYPYSYRTTTKSQVLTLRLDDWEYLLKHFPASNKVISQSYYRGPPDDRKKSSVSEDKSAPTYAPDQDRIEKKRVQIQSKTQVAPPDLWKDSSSLESPTATNDSKDYIELKSMKEGEKQLKKDLETAVYEKLTDTEEVKGKIKTEDKDDTQKFEIKESKQTKVDRPSIIEKTKEKNEYREDKTLVPSNDTVESGADKSPVSTTKTREIKEENVIELKKKTEPDVAKDDIQMKEKKESREEKPVIEAVKLTKAKTEYPPEEITEANNDSSSVDTKTTPAEEISDRKITTGVLSKKRTKEKHKFTPPTGPSLLDIGAPIIVDTNLWPMDSRRRSIVENVDRQAVASELATLTSNTDLRQSDQPATELEQIPERELSVVSIESDEDLIMAKNAITTRRKSTVHGVDRNAVAKEIESLESATTSAPMDQIQSTEKSEQVKRDRSLSDEYEDYQADLKNLKRRSTIHNVDRESVARELQSLDSHMDLTKMRDESFHDIHTESTRELREPDEESLDTETARKSTTDTEEALLKGAKFIRKMSLAAKSLISRQSTSKVKVKNKNDENDTLLMEEDERATQELIEKYEEEELRRSLQSTQSFALSDFDDYDSSKKEKRNDSLEVINESTLSIDTHQDSMASVEGFMLAQMNKARSEQREDLSDRRSKRYSNASQVSRVSKRSVRVRYQDEERSGTSSPYTLASHQVPLLQTRRLSDNTPADELTAEERNLRMMDSDLEGVVQNQGSSLDDSTVTLVPKKSSPRPPKRQ